ncbi:MAG TPA: coniferyl aldehyde dehydrogenase [Polyangiaceae bacterium]|nr:coniferyl aldehyde dehydrogenase [Polyangiaceae bacterium]
MSMAQTTSYERTPDGAESGPQAIDLRATFERLRAATRTLAAPSYEERMDGLGRLADSVLRRQDEMVLAARSDFGNRSEYETKIAEVLMVLDGIKYMRKHLKSWMRPESRHVSMTYKPARASVHYQPLGVVGVISPWNYPFQLALAPAAAAIAAGNRVLVKPSEYTPASSETLKSILADAFDRDVASVVLGGPEVGEAFSRLPFDHLLYTGSTEVGRLVMKAAAENLVPVTLELGGKSPTILHPEYPIEKAAERIAWGKCVNAGQTCIAPDYVLVQESDVSQLTQALDATIRRYYPTLAQNPDYTAVVNPRHYERLGRLIGDAVAKGAHKIEINPAHEVLPKEGRKIAPTLLTGVNDDMRVMQEEIFGPVLPIVPYRTLDDAIAYVNARARPLALYYFDDDAKRARHVLERTVSGGACVNETLLHFGIEDMPFGGVGPSGMGAYHGKKGFLTFSHEKSVLYQAKWNATGLLAPPYGERIKKLLGFLLR